MERGYSYFEKFISKKPIFFTLSAESLLSKSIRTFSNLKINSLVSKYLFAVLNNIFTTESQMKLNNSFPWGVLTKIFY